MLTLRDSSWWNIKQDYKSAKMCLRVAGVGGEELYVVLIQKWKDREQTKKKGKWSGDLEQNTAGEVKLETKLYGACKKQHREKKKNQG